MVSSRRGWRFWDVSTWMGVGLISPFPEGRQADGEPRQLRKSLTPPAVCGLGYDHAAPGPACSCGWFYSVNGGYPYTFCLLSAKPRAFTRVSPIGRVEPDRSEGVPDVFRVERLQMSGPIYLNPTAMADGLAGAIHRQFKVPVKPLLGLDPSTLSEVAQ